MAEYPDGTLYLGTYGTGLYKFNSKENCFEQCTVSNIHYCYNLSVTPHGYLAISNEKGLLIYHPETLEMRRLMPSANCIYQQSTTDAVYWSAVMEKHSSEALRA